MPSSLIHSKFAGDKRASFFFAFWNNKKLASGTEAGEYAFYKFIRVGSAFSKGDGFALFIKPIKKALAPRFAFSG